MVVDDSTTYLKSAVRIVVVDRFYRFCPNNSGVHASHEGL